MTEEQLAELAKKNIKDITSEKEAKEYQKNTQILLLAANNKEKNAILTCLEPRKDDDTLFQYEYKFQNKFLTKNAEYTFGKFGAFNAAVHLLTKQGPPTAQETIMVASDCFEYNLHAIFTVGVACGIEEKNKFLDVLVSSEVSCYDLTRYGTEKGELKTIRRGDNLTTSDFFINHFNSQQYWPDKNSVNTKKFNEASVMYLGKFLSGSGLIDNTEQKQKLLKDYPLAIGIEMEGAGLFHDQQAHGRQMMIVKAVSDFGDGEKGDKYQPSAALLATECLHCYLNEETLPERLRVYMKSKFCIISYQNSTRI